MSEKEKYSFFKKPDNRPQLRVDYFMKDRLAGSEQKEAGRKTRGSKQRDSDEPISENNIAANRISQLHEYHRRLQSRVPQPRITREAVDPTKKNNWIPLGPSAVKKGQAGGLPVVSGRVSAIAIAPDGKRMYIGSINGGVWRSLDRGQTWSSLMDAEDHFTASTSSPAYRSDTLSCGALVLIPGDGPEDDTLIVGTGEAILSGNRYFGAGVLKSTDGGKNWTAEGSTPLLAGHGFYAMAVEPIQREVVLAATNHGLYVRSGGAWIQIPLLHGRYDATFSSVVVTKNNKDEVTFYAATFGGKVYFSRERRSSWINNWHEISTGFPTSRVGRISLAAHPNDPTKIYALVALDRVDPPPPPPGREQTEFKGGNLEGIYLLKHTGSTPQWKKINHGGKLDIIFTSEPLTEEGGGSYNNVITVAPLDAEKDNIIYVGGGPVGLGAAIFRCKLNSEGTTAEVEYIGATVHADVHAIVFPPDNPNQLWIGCDGGVFVTDQPYAKNPVFESRNYGLQTMTMNYFDQHPLEESIVYCGTQDNGGQLFTGEELWLHSASGDGGYTIINRADPSIIINGYIRNQIRKTEIGGIRNPAYDSDSGVLINLGYNYLPINVPTIQEEEARFYPPIVGAPLFVDAPDLVAFGSDRLWVSVDFGETWNPIPSRTPGTPPDSAGNTNPEELTAWQGDTHTPIPTTPFNRVHISAIAIGSKTQIYVGTTDGRVFLYLSDDDNWTTPLAPLPLDIEGSTPLISISVGLPITSIAIDPTSSGGPRDPKNIYVTLGGQIFSTNGYQRVWFFDGPTKQWQEKGGDDTAKRLLNVQHNRVVLHPDNPEKLYVASDIGIWESEEDTSVTPAQFNWKPMSEGLPDAAVRDLKILPSRTVGEQTRPPLIRAATHGRGMFQRALDDVQKSPVELYIRDTVLDQGWYKTFLSEKDASGEYTTKVIHPLTKTVIDSVQSPDIKIDIPDENGYYQFHHKFPEESIHFGQFQEELVDKSDQVASMSTQSIDSRIYVQVHNRGIMPANVQVMALLARASDAEIPDFAIDFAGKIVNGEPINSGDWTTVGIGIAENARPGFPGIARIDLSSLHLPGPSHLEGNDEFFIAVFVHHPDDPYPYDPYLDVVIDGQEHFLTSRKATYKKIKLKPFTGTPPIENEALPLAGYVNIPPSATKPGAPYDGFLADAFRLNDNFIAKNFQRAFLSPYNTGQIQKDVVFKDQEGHTNPPLYPFIRAKNISVEMDLELLAGVSLVWFAMDSITIGGKIGAKGKGAPSGEEGDFGGAGGKGGGASGKDGNDCKLPSGMITVAGGTSTTEEIDPIDPAWASRALLQMTNCKGGASGGDGNSANSGGPGGGVVILCAPTIFIDETNGEIDASGGNGTANGGGGGGGLVILSGMDISGTSKISVAGGPGDNNGGKGGDGAILIKEIV